MDEIIKLLVTKNYVNDMGDPLKKIEKLERYAEKMEIGQKEFYQAAATGLKPEIKVAIWKFEYNDEKFLEYKDRTYKIIKTYERKSDEKIELTCTSTTNKEVMAYGNTEPSQNN